MSLEAERADNIEWVDYIEESDLPELYATFAKEIGKVNAVKIGLIFQGTVQQFPKLDKPLAIIRNKKIREEFLKGKTYRELALKYHLTERWVRIIIDENEADSNQISLFDFSEK